MIRWKGAKGTLSPYICRLCLLQTQMQIYYVLWNINDINVREGFILYEVVFVFWILMGDLWNTHMKWSTTKEMLIQGNNKYLMNKIKFKREIGLHFKSLKAGNLRKLPWKVRNTILARTLWGNWPMQQRVYLLSEKWENVSLYPPLILWFDCFSNLLYVFPPNAVFWAK